MWGRARHLGPQRQLGERPALNLLRCGSCNTAILRCSIAYEPAWGMRPMSCAARLCGLAGSVIRDPALTRRTVGALQPGGATVCRHVSDAWRRVSGIPSRTLEQLVQQLVLGSSSQRWHGSVQGGMPMSEFVSSRGQR